MFYGNPRIYNGDGIYNGGGAQYEFDVDLNGEKNSLIWPPYLQPVEYIDLSNFSGSNASLRSSQKMSLENDDELKLVFSLDKNIVTLATLFNMVQAIGNTIVNGNVSVSYGSSKLSINYGSVQISNLDISSLDTNTKCIARYNGSNKYLSVTDANGTSVNKTTTLSYNSPLEGCFSLFGFAATNPTSIFKGRIYYAYIKNGDRIKALYVPAKNKDDNSNKPYIAECVGATVGTDWADNTDYSTLQFGPDIDLSEMENYFA